MLSKMIEKMQKRYMAVHSYTAPKEGCLSFSAGETCTVKQKKSDGWWLVRVGEREGWTPGNYWKEESRVSSALYGDTLSMVVDYTITFSIVDRYQFWPFVLSTPYQSRPFLHANSH